jgi:N-acetylglucosamine kinase-like BadF-type ATPase
MQNTHKVIIESGATKSEWVVLDNEKGVLFHHITAGINVNYSSDEDIVAMIHNFNNAATVCTANSIREVVYYGAGCGSPENRKRIETLFANTFAQANIGVWSDLMAACHALCGHHAGLVAILGTGSSSCRYDGERIIDRAPSLGYLLGDEGSGTFLGKQFAVKLLRGHLDKCIVAEFEAEFSLKKEQFIARLYQSQEPNLLLSSFAPFIAKHIENQEIYALCMETFEQFFQNDILYYPDFRNYTLFFVGSIAYYFRRPIEDVAAQYGLVIGKILSSPIEELTRFHILKP